MPFLDHFRPPVSSKIQWSEFHAQWPAEIVRTLHDILPPGFHAGPRIYIGSTFEVDVAATEEDNREKGPPSNGNVTTQAVLAPTYTSKKVIRKFVGF